MSDDKASRNTQVLGGTCGGSSAASGQVPVDDEMIARMVDEIEVVP